MPSKTRAKSASGRSKTAVSSKSKGKQEDPSEEQFKRLYRQIRQKCTEAAIKPEDSVAVTDLFRRVIDAEDPIWPQKLIISSRTVDATVKALVSSLETIKYERLNAICFWNAEIGDEGLMTIASTLRNLKFLRRLECCDCLVGSFGCQALAAELSRSGCAHLAILKLDHNSIGSEGATALATAIGKQSAIHTLSLAYCNIDSKAASALASLLTCRKPSVRSLNLEGNDLGNEGGFILGQSLQSNTTLTNLNIALNNIGVDYATDSRVDAVTGQSTSHIGILTMDSLGRGFANCTSLTSINLDGNLIGATGALILSERIKGTSHIKGLKITHVLPRDSFQSIHNLVRTPPKKKAKKKSKKKGKKK